MEVQISLMQCDRETMETIFTPVPQVMCLVAVRKVFRLWQIIELRM